MTTIIRCYTNSFLPIKQLKSLPIDAFDVSLWKEEKHPPPYYQLFLTRNFIPRVKLVWFLNLGMKYVVDVSKIQWIASIAQILEIRHTCYRIGEGKTRKLINQIANQITTNNPHMKRYMRYLINSIPIKRNITMSMIQQQKMYSDYNFSFLLPKKRRIFKICRINVV